MKSHQVMNSEMQSPLPPPHLIAFGGQIGMQRVRCCVFAEALARGSVFMGLPFKWTLSLEMSQSPHVPWRRSDPDLDLNFEAHLFYLSVSKRVNSSASWDLKDRNVLFSLLLMHQLIFFL